MNFMTRHTLLHLLLVLQTAQARAFSAPSPPSSLASISAPPPSSSSSSSSLSTVDTASLSSHSLWQDIPDAPPDAILGIAQAYQQCNDARKVNVCVGAYRDENGQPWVLPSVRTAEERMLLLQQQQQSPGDAAAGGGAAAENKEYLPIAGDEDFINYALAFAYGPHMHLSRVAGVQTLSGTGACRIGGIFLARFWPKHKTIYIPTPTWGNHWKIFEECGLKTVAYRYYDSSHNRLDFAGLLQDISDAPKGSIILLHACAHNPTGCDPTFVQWKELLTMMQTKQHVAFFDSAYQGFASGHAEKDAAALRLAVDMQVPVLLAQSFAKNFGLYGERCGTLSIVCDSAKQKESILSQLRSIIRPMYSSPPKHGSSIVRTILADEQLKTQYYNECARMAQHIQDMRTGLVEELQKVGSTHDWSHITEQIGMFAFTGISKEMCDQLTNEYAIFLTKDGRFSLAGLNKHNLAYVAQALHDVTDGKRITS